MYQCWQQCSNAGNNVPILATKYQRHATFTVSFDTFSSSFSVMRAFCCKIWKSDTCSAKIGDVGNPVVKCKLTVVFGVCYLLPRVDGEVDEKSQNAMELTTKIYYLAFLVVCLGVLPTVCQVAEARRNQDDFSPRITEHPANLIVAKTEPATLNCKAEGQPRPTIQWLKDGQPVETIAEDPKSHRTLLPSGSLFFLRIIHGRRNKPDAGVYQCVATNYLGTVYSNNATLEVAILKDEFREEPQDVIGAAGDQAELRCAPPRGFPEPEALWEKNGERVIVDGQRIQQALEGHLIFAQVRREDAGRYVCLGRNIVGIKRSREVTLIVREKPTFIVTPSDVTAVVSDDIDFYCTVSGDPAVTVSWNKKDGVLPAGRYQILDDNTLKIKEVSIVDEGTYVCTGENNVGASHAEARLSIHAEPAFTTVPRDRVVAVNKKVTFECRASGNPPPAIFWQKPGGEQLLFPGQVQDRFSVTQEGELEIEDVQLEDEGFYTCSALSVAGTSTVRANLKVIVLTDSPPPIIRQGPSNQTLAVDSIAMLSCQASGEPSPSIRWVKDNFLIIAKPRIALLDDGTLQISDLRIGDTGKYTCIASSDSGETDWSAYLTVIERTETTTSLIHRTPEPSSFPGQPSRPEASNITKTSVKLTWRPNSNRGASAVTNYIVEYYSRDVGSGWTVVSRNVHSENFVVRKLRPSTTYIFLVRAVNSHGVSLPSGVSQSITTKTDGVGNPTITQNTSELQKKLNAIQMQIDNVDTDNPYEATVIWEVGQFQRNILTGFSITLQSKNSRVGHTRQYDIAAENLKFGRDKKANKRHTVQDLTPYTVYTLTVVPYRELPPDLRLTGRRIESTFTTPMAPPSAPPRNVTAKSNGSDAILIQWQPPPRERHNGIINGYHVWCLGNASGFHVNKTTDNGTFYVLLHNLVPGMLYAIQVAAFTRPGIGVANDKIYVQLDPIVSTMAPQAVSLGQKIVGVLKKPFFIVPVGVVVWIALLLFVVILYKRRRLKHALAFDNIKLDHVSRPPGDTSTMSTSRNCTMNHDGTSAWMDQNWQHNSVSPYKTMSPPPACCFQNGSAVGSNYQPNVLDVDGQMKEDNIMSNDNITNVFIGPDMFAHSNIPEYAEVGSIPRELLNPLDHKSLNVIGKEHNVTQPYASTTLVMPPNIKDNLDKNYGGNLDKPWLQPPYYNSKKRHDKSIDTENSGSSSCTLPSHLRMNDSCATSPVSDSGSYTQDSGGSGRRKKKNKGHKQPALNWADLLPPPPEHPPPTDIDSPPDSPQYHVLGSPIPSQYSVKSSQGYQTDLPDDNASVAASHRSHASMTNRHLLPKGTNPNSTAPAPPVRRQAEYPMATGMPMDGVHHNDNMRDMPIHSLNKKHRNGHPYSTSGSSHNRERQTNPQYGDIAVCNSVPLQNCESALETDYTDNEDYPKDEHLMPMLPARLEDTPHGPGLSIDLPLPNSDNGLLSEMSDADTSIRDGDMDGDTESNCTGSMMASWASLDGSSGTSARCSAISDSSDGSFFTDADFASAVAAAAESAGLKVEGTKVIDPHAGHRKLTPSQRAQQRSGSPMTDTDIVHGGKANKAKHSQNKYKHQQQQHHHQQQQQQQQQHHQAAPKQMNQQPRDEQSPHGRPNKPAKPEKPDKLVDRKGSHKKSQKSRQDSERQKTVKSDDLTPEDVSEGVIPYNKPSFPSTSSSDTSSRGSTGGRRRHERPYNPAIMNDGNEAVSSLQDTNDIGLRVTANPLAFQHDQNNHFKA
ncbi:roundabout homolog 1-like [Glandiceps talaboti]